MVHAGSPRGGAGQVDPREWPGFAEHLFRGGRECHHQQYCWFNCRQLLDSSPMIKNNQLDAAGFYIGDVILCTAAIYLVDTPEVEVVDGELVAVIRRNPQSNYSGCRDSAAGRAGQASGARTAAGGQRANPLQEDD